MLRLKHISKLNRKQKKNIILRMNQTKVTKNNQRNRNKAKYTIQMIIQMTLLTFKINKIPNLKMSIKKLKNYKNRRIKQYQFKILT